MFNQVQPSQPLKKCQILPGLAAVTTLGLTAITAQPAAAVSLIPVDTELSLLIDVSGSVDADEYVLQLEGYQTAFTNLAPRFGGEEFGSVAVNLIQWSAFNEQEISINWALLDSEDAALQFANTVAEIVRPGFTSFFGATAPGTAIEFATPLFSTNEYDGQRWVMDVSGDGVRNGGVNTKTARDSALAAGVDAINGLPIVPPPPSFSVVDDWYRNNIQGGEGSFTIPAFGFEDIGRALEQKLIAELTLPPSAPEPPVIEPPVIEPPVVEPPVVEPPAVEPPVTVPEPLTLWGLGAVLAGLRWRKQHRRDLASFSTSQ